MCVFRLSCFSSLLPRHGVKINKDGFTVWFAFFNLNFFFSLSLIFTLETGPVPYHASQMSVWLLCRSLFLELLDVAFVLSSSTVMAVSTVFHCDVLGEDVSRVLEHWNHVSSWPDHLHTSSQHSSSPLGCQRISSSRVQLNSWSRQFASRLDWVQICTSIKKIPTGSSATEVCYILKSSKSPSPHLQAALWLADSLLRHQQHYLHHCQHSERSSKKQLKILAIIINKKKSLG